MHFIQVSLKILFITSLSCQESAESTDGKNSVFNVLSESFPANVQECSKSFYFYSNTCMQLLIRNSGVHRGTSKMQKGCGQLAKGKTFPDAKKNKYSFQSCKKHSSPFSKSKSLKKGWTFLWSFSWESHESRAGASCATSPWAVGLWSHGENFHPKMSGIFLCSSVGMLQSSSVNVSLRVSLLQPLLIITFLRAASPTGCFPSFCASGFILCHFWASPKQKKCKNLLCLENYFNWQ